MRKINLNQVVTKVNDGPASARQQAANREIHRINLAIEAREAQQEREKHRWWDIVESVTGANVRHLSPSVDSTLSPMVFTLYAAVVLAFGLELVASGALADLLLNLPTAIAITVGCLLASAYALIAKATITAICVRHNRPNQSLRRTTLVAIIFGLLSLAAIAFFTIVRIKAVGVDAANASLTAVNLTLPVAAAAFAVMAWTLSAPNRIASKFIKTEIEIMELKNIRSQLEPVANGSRGTVEIDEAMQAAGDESGEVSDGGSAVKTGHAVAKTNGSDRPTQSAMLPTLLVAMTLLGFGAGQSAEACEQEVSAIQIVVDRTGSLRTSAAEQVMKAIGNEVAVVQARFPCVREISAFGFSGEWEPDGVVAQAQIPAPPDPEALPAGWSESEAVKLFTMQSDQRERELAEFRAAQRAAHQAVLVESLQDIREFLSGFDWSASAQQTCLYQQLLSLSFAPADTISMLVTDGHHQACPFDSASVDLLAGENSNVIVVLVPSATDRGDALPRLVERQEAIRSLFPNVTLVAWLKVAMQRPGWLANLARPVCDLPPVGCEAGTRVAGAYDGGQDDE